MLRAFIAGKLRSANLYQVMFRLRRVYWVDSRIAAKTWCRGQSLVSRGPRTPIPQDRTSGACVPAEIQWPAISTRIMALLWIASRAITAVLDAQIRARATSPLEPQWMTEVATSSVAMGAPSRVRAITIKQRPKMMARVSLQAAWNLAPATIWQMQGAMTEAATFRAARARVAVSTARSGMRSWKVAWLRTQPMSTSMGALA